ncbi:hypothetical protein LV75_000447 [Actinokineospora diospyrosa]|uniref:Uncharacterized protein n=1 Tax=Actinokineospora diospyrosa TaxID=103728 RepID=A0ABT1I5S2_9PSEU|nr:hypothetical protein [Actinokineospora diospyrosa]
MRQLAPGEQEPVGTWWRGEASVSRRFGVDPGAGYRGMVVGAPGTGKSYLLSRIAHEVARSGTSLTIILGSYSARTIASLVHGDLTAANTLVGEHKTLPYIADLLAVDTARKVPDSGMFDKIEAFWGVVGRKVKPEPFNGELELRLRGIQLDWNLCDLSTFPLLCSQVAHLSSHGSDIEWMVDWCERVVTIRDYVRAFLTRLEHLLLLGSPVVHVLYLVRASIGRVWRGLAKLWPPGRCVTACGQVTRGPSAQRMTSSSVMVVRGRHALT